MAACFVVLICSLSVRLFITLRTDQVRIIRENADAASYILPARSLLQHGAFLDVYGRPEISRTPGYPAFLAAIMLLVGQDLRSVLIAQAIILSFEVLVIYAFAIRIFTPLVAFVAGFLAALSPWSGVLSGMPLSEGLFLLLLALIFLAMKITVEADRRTTLAVGGTFTGLFTASAVLVRPIWPLLILIAVALFFLYGPNRKRVWLLLSIMVVCASVPIYVWKARNQKVSQFNGLSDIAGQCAWQMLAPRVLAHLNDQDKWTLKRRAIVEENSWRLTIEKSDQERWRRARKIFLDHPFLTGYYFLLSGLEHAFHPSPEVLAPAKVNFYGDYWLLAGIWAGLLLLAYFGWRPSTDVSFQNPTDTHQWLASMLIICLLLTFSSGLCFGAGSRYRVSLELIVPLLASAGILRIITYRRMWACARRERCST